MKKRIIILVLVLACLLSLSACGCKHENWIEANCTTPKTCEKCGETEGYPNGHSWIIANCTTPQTCEHCGETVGEAPGHSWVEATYVDPQTCSVCGETEGEPLPAPFLGTWETVRTCTAEDAGIQDFDYLLSVTYTFTFSEDGAVNVEVTKPHRDQFYEDVLVFYAEYLYYEMEKDFDMDRAAVDALLKTQFDADITALANQSLNESNIMATMEETTTSGTWSFVDGKLYMDLTLVDIAIIYVSDPSVPNDFSVDGDTVTVYWLSTGEDTALILNRVGE